MRLSAFLALLASLSACGSPQRPGAAHGPIRIMSMNPCIDAIVVRVADPGEIASISHYSHEAAATSIPLDVARRFPANAGTAEEVVATQPSIVLMSPHGDPATVAAIRRAGVRIESIGVPATVAESRDQIAAIARIAGHPERGAALVAQIEAALTQAQPAPGTAPVEALIRGREGLVPGSGTLADELLARAGFRNMSATYGLAMWDMLPLEPLMARPPRVLLIDLSNRGALPAPLRAVRTMRVADFPARMFQCAGPNIIEAARRLAEIRRSSVRQSPSGERTGATTGARLISKSPVRPEPVEGRSLLSAVDEERERASTSSARAVVGRAVIFSDREHS